MDATQVVFACKRDNCLPPRSDVPGLLRINLVVSQRAIVLLKISHISTLIAYPAAPVVLITDSPALILITFSSSLLLLASLVGVTGTLLNSRPILAIYVLRLFPSFISFVSVGYVTYKKASFSLDAKASEAWNFWYSAGVRTVLQGTLGCCGWSGPLHAAFASGTCYPRSPLPGRHGPLVRLASRTDFRVGHGVFACAAALGEHSRRAPLRKSRNSPLWEGNNPRAVPSHCRRHLVCGTCGPEEGWVAPSPVPCAH